MTKLKPYADCGDSGIDRLPEVPAGWQVARIKSRVRIVTERADERSYPVALENVEGWTGRLVESTTEFAAEGIKFAAGDVLFGKLRPYLAKSWTADRAGEAVGDFFVMRPQNGLNPKFLNYVTLSPEFISMVDGSTFGSKMPRASWDFIANIRHPFPGPELQSKIVSFLDRQTAQIDELIGKQEQLIDLLAEKRQAIITHAVTKGLDPTAPTKPSGIPWLGDVPTHWDVPPLKYLLQETLKYGANESAEFDNPDWPRYLRITDFELTGALKNHTFRSLPPHIAAGYMVKPGDVLFARSGATVGKTFIVPEDSPSSCFAGYLIKASCDRDKLLPSFFAIYTKSSVFAEWKDASLTVATIQNIGADKLADLTVPVPPLAEQLEIMRHLQGRLSKLDVLMGKAGDSVALLRERRSALISAAVTGQIDVQEGAAQV